MGPWLVSGRWVGGATRRSPSRRPLRLRRPRSPRGGGVDPASLSAGPAHAAETPPPDRPVESRRRRRCRNLQMSPDPPLHTNTEAHKREGVRWIDSGCASVF